MAFLLAVFIMVLMEPVHGSTRPPCVRRKMIIDVDTGFDDAEAIMLALSRPDIDVVAITCVNGNVKVDRVTTNTMKVLQVCQRTDVPVFKGASYSLLGRESDERYGVPSWRDLPPVKLNHTEHAANALVRLVNQFAGEITLVALGPLTNIALALYLDPEFPKKVREFVIMGGNADANGPVGATPEYNFFVDPEAAHMVLSSMPNTRIMPFEVCNRHLLPWDFVMEWLGKNTPKSKFLRNSLEHDLKTYKEISPEGFPTWDPFAMSIVVDGSAATEEKTTYATVELSGMVSRAHMVVDWFDQLKKEKNVALITGLNNTKIQQLLLSMVL